MTNGDPSLAFRVFNSPRMEAWWWGPGRRFGLVRRRGTLGSVAEPGNGHPLLLPAGELGGGPRPSLQVHQLPKLPGPVFPPGYPGDLHGESRSFFRQVALHPAGLKLWKIMVIFRRLEPQLLFREAACPFRPPKPPLRWGPAPARLCQPDQCGFPRGETDDPEDLPLRMSRQMSSRAWTGSAPPPKVLAFKC